MMQGFSSPLQRLLDSSSGGAVKVEMPPGTFARRAADQVEVGDRVLVERDPDKGLLPVRWSGPSTLLLRSGDTGYLVEVSKPFLATVTGRRVLATDSPGDDDMDATICLDTGDGPVIVLDRTVVAVPIIEYRSGQ